MLINLIFRLRFPSGHVTATDFRPNVDGHLLNACAYIPAGLDAERVETALSRKLQLAFTWMRRLRFLMRPGDKVQYCLGTRKPRRQYMKAVSSRDDLAAGVPPTAIAEYWRHAVSRV